MNITQSSPVRKALGAATAVAVISVAAGLAGTTPASAAGAQSGARAAAAPRAASVAPAAVHAGAVVAPRAVVAPNAAPPPLTPDCTNTCDLWAEPGTVTVNQAPAPVTLPVWSFMPSDTAATGRSALIFGTVGTPITITLHNNLPAAAGNVGLAIPTADGFKTDEIGVANDGTSVKSYTFTPTRPGTYVYNASLTKDGARQTAMGLAGAIVVRPSGSSAFDVAESDFQDEAVLVYTDVDAAFAAAPMTYNMRDYKPAYHLINGKAYPDAGNVYSDVNRSLMLRLVNGSILDKSPTLLGTTMTAFARSSRPLPTPLTTSGRMIAAGDSLDARLVMPGADTRFALYDAPGGLSNYGEFDGVNAPALGGAMTFIVSGGVPGVTPKGPAVTALAVAGQPGNATRPLTVTTTLDTSARGGMNLLQAEYFVDTVGALGAGTPIAGIDTGVTVQAVPAFTLDLSLVASGTHTLYVRGADRSGAWGPVRAMTFRVDKDGPAVTGVVLSASNVSVQSGKNLTFSATIDDTNTGGSYVASNTTCAVVNSGQTCPAARAWIDGTEVFDITKPYISLNTNGPRVVAATSGTIPASTIATLTEGTHILYVQGEDVLGQFGAAQSTSSASGPVYGTPFVVDKTAPQTQLVTVTPSTTNGTSGNPAHPGTIRITADVIDPVASGVNSPLSAVEMYLNPPTPLPATGSVSGILMSYSGVGGTYGSAVSARYIADMPLSWIGGFTTANVNVVVVGLDKAGNRATTTAAAGPAATANLFVDRVAPTLSFTVNQAANAATATITATAADAAPGTLAGVDYWLGTGAAPALGTNPIISGTATLNLNALHLVCGETITVNVRAWDGLGNVKVLTQTYTLTPQLFCDNFNASTLSGWTTAGGSAPTLTTTTPIEGARSLIANAATTAVGYVVHNQSAATPSVTTGYSAHFQFAPGIAATGTGSNYATILAGSTTSAGGNVLQVRYLRQGTGVRFALCVGSTPTCTTTASQTVAAASTYNVKVDYNAGGTSTLTVTTGAQTWTATTTTGSTAAQTVQFVKLGVVAKSASFSTGYRFDTFASARAPF